MRWIVWLSIGLLTGCETADPNVVSATPSMVTVCAPDYPSAVELAENSCRVHDRHAQITNGPALFCGIEDINHSSYHFRCAP